MSKFSDIPFFLIQKYFDDIALLNDNTTSSFSLLGSGKSIVTKGGNIIEVYIIDGGAYKEVWLSPVETNFITDEKYLLFKKHNKGIYDETGSSTTYSLNGAEFTVYDPVSSENVTIDDGSDVYIRKDSIFHTWIINEAESYYISNWYSDFLIRNFVNVDKTFIYFGDIFSDTSPNYRIRYNSLKWFSLDAIPQHQRTDDIKEFFNLYFDKVFSEVYNRLKDLKTLNDPLEIDINYIDYIADMYNFSLSDEFSNSIKRYFMRSIVDILKRKGTYASIYDLWYILTNSINRLNIYERWYDKDLSGTLTESNFDDYLYLDRYIGYFDRSYLESGVGFEYYKDYIWETSYLDTYTFYGEQETADITWNITHNLGTQNIIVEFYDTSSARLSASDWDIIDDNTIIATFNTEQSGHVYIVDLDVCPTDATEYDENFEKPGSKIIPEYSGGTDQLTVYYDDPVGKAFSYEGKGFLWTSGDEPETKVWGRIFDTTLKYYCGLRGWVQQPSSSTYIRWGLLSNYGGETELSNCNYYFAELRAVTGEFKIVRDDTTLVSGTLGANVYDSWLYFDLVYDHGTISLTLDSTTISVEDNNLTEFNAWGGYVLNPGDVTYYDNIQAYFREPNGDFIKTLEPTSTKIKKKKMSPYYIVEVDFTDEPLRTSKLIGSDWHEKMIDYWEKMRIVDRRSFYNLICAPVTDYTGNYIQLYKNNEDVYLKTRFEGDDSYKTTTSSDYKISLVEDKKTTWEITHDFNTKNILCCVYSINKRIFPSEIECTTPNKVVLTFNSPTSGVVVLRKSGFNNKLLSSETTFDHTLNTEYLVTQFYDTSNKQIMLEKVDIIDNDTIEVESLVSTNALLLKYNYYEDITTSSSTWNINHELNNKYVLAEFYDSNNEQIMPKELELISDDLCKATFDDSITGRAVINSVGSISLFDKLNSNFTFEFYDEQDGTIPVYNNTITDLYQDTNYIYIECESAYTSAYTVKEIRIIDLDGEIIFKSKCSDIDKIKDTKLKFVLKIDKGEL